MQDPEIHNLMVAAVNADPNHGVSKQFFLVCWEKVQQHASHWLLHYLCQKIVTSHLQETPALCVLRCVATQQMSG